MEKKQKIVVLGIIENSQGHILVTERLDPKIKEAHKKWDVPWWTNEFWESLEETLLREIEEETGVIVKDLQVLPKHYSKFREHTDFLQHTLLFCYTCKLDWGDLNVNDPKIGEIKRVSIEEALKLDLLETTAVFLKKYLETKNR